MLIQKELLSIGEVAQVTGIPVHTIRFWESEFNRFISPVRTSGRQRRYSEIEVNRILEIKRLLKEDKYSIAGAKQVLSTQPLEPMGGPRRPPRRPGPGAERPGVGLPDARPDSGLSPDRRERPAPGLSDSDIQDKVAGPGRGLVAHAGDHQELAPVGLGRDQEMGPGLLLHPAQPRAERTGRGGAAQAKGGRPGAPGSLCPAPRPGS